MLYKAKQKKAILVQVKDSDQFHTSPEIRRQFPHGLAALRLLVAMGLLSVFVLLFWVSQEEHQGYWPLFILFAISIGYKLLKILFEWYHYWSVSLPIKPKLSKVFTVDMLTTAVPGEPYAMTEKTLRAMVAVRYPHTTYLCDEGNDPYLKQLCHELGVIHITRNDRKDAKAGNINNALSIANGEICVVLDPDHIPHPQFLDEVLPYFVRKEVGFVQIVQAYHNYCKSWIASGAAEQTFTFYGPLMMGMNSYGTAQAIGANCTFRRKALDSIGGHAPGLAEDMHTAMQLHALGWESVYVPKILARGLVPVNLAAYYKQQLKWSRGTFELLFRVFPKLFFGFSWRQKLHYFLLPLHFAAGIITVIDILIPVISLLTGYSPLYFENAGIAIVLLPFLLLVLLIRQYAQRWLHDKEEQGLHLSGGILLMGTWWVYLLGFIYTIFRIKIPYIATPKEDERTNSFVLTVPNLLFCCVNVVAIVIGLNLDWSPFSLIMAGCCLLNTVLLLYTVIGSQQVLMERVRLMVKKVIPYQINRAISNCIDSALQLLCKTMRQGALVYAFALVVSIAWIRADIALPSFPIFSKKLPDNQNEFYTGIYIPQVQEQQSLNPVFAFEATIERKMDIISVYHFWGPESIERFPMEQLNGIAEKGSIPMITWEPWVSFFPEQKDAPYLKNEIGAMAAISSGKFDDYIKAYAGKIKLYDRPVFIRFAHEPDNPQFAWSSKGNNTAEDYKSSWRRIVSIFAETGVNNVAWVYNPWSNHTVKDYYPGDDYIDWIGITCLNYGKASWDGRWRSFEELYSPYRPVLLALNKPVMLAEFGSTHYGGSGDDWVKEAVHSIQRNYKEIKSFVLFNSNQDKYWITDWRPDERTGKIDWTLRDAKEVKKTFFEIQSVPNDSLSGSYSRFKYPIDFPSKHTASLTGALGSFTFTVCGKPYYIKGIAYNPEQSVQDGNHPLTRRQLEKDFSAILEMGANTIRRYHPTVYDKNIFREANKQGLKVIYGFWFDPSVDYYKDTAAVTAYVKFVKEKVSQYKIEPALLFWNIGNETSGHLKKYYRQPYLTKVRNAFVQMLEKITVDIHSSDPEHPVATSLEHSNQLPGELVLYKQLAPSIDLIGINSYYVEQISKLDTLFQQFDGSRPYFISEFGPKGYWDHALSDFDENRDLLEESDAKKARLYSKEWDHFILPYKGRNVGGVAFCWKDRFEGTATWFGLTDNKGRMKLAYHALKSAWTNTSGASSLPDLFIAGPMFSLKPGGKYTFTAKLSDQKYSHIEWVILEEGSFQKENLLHRTAHNKTEFSVPRSLKDYRLYVFAADNQGNVITANKILRTYKGIYNDGL